MSEPEPLTKNQRYEAKQRALGLVKMTVWIPEHTLTETHELLGYIKEQYLKKTCRTLIPFMFRCTVTGVMGVPSDKDIGQCKMKDCNGRIDKTNNPKSKRCKPHIEEEM